MVSFHEWSLDGALSPLIAASVAVTVQTEYVALCNRNLFNQLNKKIVQPFRQHRSPIETGENDSILRHCRARKNKCAPLYRNENTTADMQISSKDVEMKVRTYEWRGLNEPIRANMKQTDDSKQTIRIVLKRYPSLLQPS